MKKITNKEIIDKFEKLLNSYSDEELSKIIEKEYDRIKLKDKKNPEWLNEIKSKKPAKGISKIKFEVTTEDEGEFVWTKRDYEYEDLGIDNFLDSNICKGYLEAA